ncbi:hypothetical protein BJP42_04410 [Candidatus Williamhamiltonella defendens]|nr:hypothetical protein BJP42_04410 [Candidatus Hamiltonella defensa]
MISSGIRFFKRIFADGRPGNDVRGVAKAKKTKPPVPVSNFGWLKQDSGGRHLAQLPVRIIASVQS